uniref:Calponin-homology (CH) domain-containing protein n=1 Tax=Xiphophorus couchianus TaxID=32473 RepID=A0A3B5M923_9TELE
ALCPTLAGWTPLSLFYYWLLAATGRCFGDKNFRGRLENGILLCELLSSIRPGLVKKINRLPTPIAVSFFRNMNITCCCLWLLWFL